MPRISSFYGVAIEMYFEDYARPHFHARSGEYEAKVEIDTGRICAGTLPRQKARLVREWARVHRSELNENWSRARKRIPLAKIDPLL